MMRFNLTLFILALTFVGIYAEECAISCPQDCEFGLKLDRTDETCPKCVCSDNICSRVRCTSGTTCKLVTNKDCWNSQCIDATTVTCAPNEPEKCEISCPQDCEFGFQLDRTDETCPKCVCSDNICMRVKCTANTTCKLVKNKDCWNSQCIDATSANCVSIVKKGNCPVKDLFSKRQVIECSNDMDCQGDLKCCTYSGSNICTSPCPQVLCKCAKTARIAIEKDSKGCSRCKCVSVKSTQTDGCSQSLEHGRCKGAIPRYFYHSESDSCKPFTYSGCQGNDNNFVSLEYCEKKCVKSKSYHSNSDSTDICALPKETGPCRAALERYFYNTETKSCELFSFGGCHANENNFKTLQDCQSRCGNYKENLAPGSLVKNKCALPMKKGECRSAIPRYYFNLNMNKCEEFLYSGCSGNDNNFATINECKQECLPFEEEEIVKRLDPKCTKPKDVGPCRAAFRKYFFNMATKSCDEFTYGGCHGNENNFDSYSDCYNSCAESFSRLNYNLINLDVQPKNSKCLLEKKVGSCEAIIPRYFFNKETKKCEKFNYGGCGGNENNFKTLEECEADCSTSASPKVQTLAGSLANTCSLPKEMGPCRGYFIRFFYNPSTKTCDQFVYGGCQANANNFETLEQCSATCIKPPQQSYPVNPPNPVSVDQCLLDEEMGPCKAAFTKYFFNRNTGKCETFIYGGCQGNGNRFDTEEECYSNCLYRSGNPPTTPKPSKCSYQKDSGPCYAYITNYFYNQNTKQCDQFVYGGCGGNENRFETKEECNKQCISYVTYPVTPPITTIKPSANRCQLSPDMGPCKAAFTRYFYNWKTGKCEVFTYGGCGGNDNRFETQSECSIACGYSNPVTTPSTYPNKCSLPAEPGKCKGFFPKFFYNSATKRCESFTYGGCDGNENRFDSQEECNSQCGGYYVNPYPVTPPITTIKPSKCLQDKAEGTCKGAFGRYFFNQKTSQCELFTYGGCGGNDNRFETYSQCNTECAAYIKPATNPPTARPSPCTLNQEPGPCKGAFTKYFFNKNSGRCEMFIYGGCGGNDNRFDSLSDCNSKCTTYRNPYSPKSSKCAHPKESGMCMAFMPRYYYNETTSRCERFIYGGCGGNENNFETIQECISECSSISNYEINPTCQVSSDPGRCMATFTKYFFNTGTSSCEEFTYGGCGGNQNNFDSLDDCNIQCFNLKSD